MTRVEVQTEPMDNETAGVAIAPFVALFAGLSWLQARRSAKEPLAAAQRQSDLMLSESSLRWHSTVTMWS